MIQKLIPKKNLILIIYAAVLLVSWILALIFGNREDKLMVLILSLIIPFVVYGFVRLMYKVVHYKVVHINASPKVMSFFYYFFLVGGLLGTLMMIVEFIDRFPNGLSPTLGACGAMIIATLDSAKKTFENADES